MAKQYSTSMIYKYDLELCYHHHRVEYGVRERKCCNYSIWLGPAVHCILKDLATNINVTLPIRFKIVVSTLSEGLSYTSDQFEASHLQYNTFILDS